MYTEDKHTIAQCVEHDILAQGQGFFEALSRFKKTLKMELDISEDLSHITSKSKIPPLQFNTLDLDFGNANGTGVDLLIKFPPTYF